jgi:hypothetical protein
VPPPCCFLLARYVGGHIGTDGDYSYWMYSSVKHVARPEFCSKLVSLATLCAPPEAKHDIFIFVRQYTSFICPPLQGGCGAIDFLPWLRFASCFLPPFKSLAIQTLQCMYHSLKCLAPFAYVGSAVVCMLCFFCISRMVPASIW